MSFVLALSSARRNSIRSLISRRSRHLTAPYIHLPPTSARFQSTTASEPPHDRPAFLWFPRVLIAFGFGALSFGLWTLYSAMTIWPPQIRGDLRAGIKARNSGDLGASMRHLARAFQTAYKLPREALEPDYHLKLTGIAITLSSVLEDSDKPSLSYRVLKVALNEMRGATKDAQHLSTRERLRGVAMGLKLSELAETCKMGEDTEEAWLVWSVDEVLEMVRAEINIDKPLHVDSLKPIEDSNHPIVLGELPLPDWVTAADVGAPMEALGAFYAKTGQPELAVPLYLQAISLILPSDTSPSRNVEQVCRAAQLMSNLSSVLLDAPRPDQRQPSDSPTLSSNVEQALSWAQKAHGVICAVHKPNATTTKKATTENIVCDAALGSILFNLGMLMEMSNDHTSALSFYKETLRHYKSLPYDVPGKEEGLAEVKKALQRIENGPGQVDAGSTS